MKNYSLLSNFTKTFLLFCGVVMMINLLPSKCLATNPSVVQWDYYMNSFTGAINREDWLYDVKSTSDGGFLAVGYVEEIPSGNQHALVIKLNARGDREWVKIVDPSVGPFSSFWDAVETSDGSFLCVGQGQVNTVDKLMIAKLDQSGNVIGSPSYLLLPNNSSNVGYGITEVINNTTNTVKYVITGTARGTNLSATATLDIFVLRIDANLAQVGSVTYLGNTDTQGGTYIGHDWGRSIGTVYVTGIDPVLGPQGNAQGIVVAGYVTKNNNSSDFEDICVATLDLYGAVGQTKYINAPSSNNSFYVFNEQVPGCSVTRNRNDHAGRVAQISDGNIVLAAELNFCFCCLGVNADGGLYKLNKTSLSTIWKSNVIDLTGRLVQVNDLKNGTNTIVVEHVQLANMLLCKLFANGVLAEVHPIVIVKN